MIIGTSRGANWIVWQLWATFCASHFWFGGVWPWQCSRHLAFIVQVRARLAEELSNFSEGLKGSFSICEEMVKTHPQTIFVKIHWRKQQVAFCPAFTVLHSKRAIVSHTLCLPERLLLNAGPLVGCFAMFCYLESCTFLFFFVDENHGSKTWHGDMSQWVRHLAFFRLPDLPAAQVLFQHGGRRLCHCKSVLGWITPPQQLHQIFLQAIGWGDYGNVAWGALMIRGSRYNMLQPLLRCYDWQTGTGETSLQSRRHRVVTFHSDCLYPSFFVEYTIILWSLLAMHWSTEICFPASAPNIPTRSSLARCSNLASAASMMRGTKLQHAY